MSTKPTEYPVIKRTLAAALVSLWATAAFAEKIDIVCTAMASDESMSYLIDVATNTVSREGVLANEVQISQNRIFFSYPYKNTKFTHSINRITGRLSVESGGIAVGGAYLCDRNRPKF